MDKYQPLRDAIAAGPTEGPWKSMPVRSGYYIQSASVPAVVVDTTDEEGRYGAIANEADAALIAAADPLTIATLLADYDAMREALQGMVRYVGIPTVLQDRPEFKAARDALAKAGA